MYIVSNPLYTYIFRTTAQNCKMAAPGITNILKPLEEQTNVDKRADGYLRYFRERTAKTCRELEDRRKVQNIKPSFLLNSNLRKKYRMCRISRSPMFTCRKPQLTMQPNLTLTDQKKFICILPLRDTLKPSVLDTCLLSSDSNKCLYGGNLSFDFV